MSAPSGEVQITEHLGGESFLYVAIAAGETIVVEIPGQVSASPGERIGLQVEPGKHHFFGQDGAVIAALD